MTELSAADLTRSRQSTVEVLAGIHQVRDARRSRSIRPTTSPRPPLSAASSGAQHGYYEWAREGRRVPAIEEALAALDGTVPHNRPVGTQLGRQSDRQHHLPGLPTGRRPRLGDGDHRTARG